MLILHRPWDSQPPETVGLDRSNPLAATITHFLPLNGDRREIVTGARITYGAGGSIVPTQRGTALQGSGGSARASVSIDLSSYTKLTVSFWLYWDSYTNTDLLAMEYGANFATNSGFLIDPSSGAPASGLFQAGVASPSAAMSFQWRGQVLPLGIITHSFSTGQLAPDFQRPFMLTAFCRRSLRPVLVRTLLTTSETGR